MNEEERKAIEELEEFIKGPCETCKYCEAAYKLNRKNIIQLLNLTKKLQKENEELKNNTRKNENELEFDVDCDWIALQKILDKSEKSNEYISYKNEKWINEKYCIPIQKIKNKMKKEIETNEHIILGGRRNGKTLEYGKRLGRIEMCQELLEGREENEC